MPVSSSSSSRVDSSKGETKSPPITRNLTTIFARQRHSRRGTGGRFAGGADGEFERLLDVEAGGRGEAREMQALPPQWVESAEDAKENIKHIREKLVKLTKAQQTRLLRVFSDDTSPDREVEQIASQISALVRTCEQHIHQVKTRGNASASDQDVEFRQNVQRNLATQLTQLSQQFRQSQKDYLNDVRRRQQGSAWDDSPAPSVLGNRGEAAGGALDDFGFNETQLQELQEMEQNATQRNEEIRHIASSITDLHTVFKELAVLVIDQGSILDRIDYNIEQVVVQSGEANKQLQKAEESAKSNRAMKCIYFLVVVNLVLIVILIVKARH